MIPLRRSVYHAKNIVVPIQEGKEYNIYDREIKRKEHNNWFRRREQERAVQCGPQTFQEAITTDFDITNEPPVSSNGAQMSGLPFQQNRRVCLGLE